MAAEITQIDIQDFTSQTYGGQEIGLISSFDINTSLSSSSYIEYFIYDNNQNLLSTDYNFIQYTILNNGQSAGSNNDISQILIDPETSLINDGFDQGEYITYFNFLNKQIGSELQQLYIVEISSDRTEIRLNSTSLTNIDIIEQANSLIQQREDSPYFLDFYLNFGENQLAIANNIQLDNQDPNNPTILIKLYEVLPEEFDINSTLWIVTLIEEPIAYKITFEDTPIIITDTISLNGPNFNLDIQDQINNSTVSLDYTTLTSTALTSSRNQLQSLLEEKGLDINIDYTNFNDFVHFSSVEARLENFYYKMSLLEDYSSSIAILNNTTNNNPSASLAVYESLSSNIITNFDDYEYYLYYTSESISWPKTTSQPPYQLALTGSAAVDIWYDNITLSASNYDNLNQNNLYYSIPEYLRDDSANAPYQTFIEMVGQFYDNIWIYYRDVTQKYNADNRLEYGVSKDIVADAIRDFGIKLYQNNFSNEDLYTAFLGITPEGGLFPFPNITGSLPTPSGFEYVDTLISASNDYMPLDDVNKSLYKRIYHNLPYLLKAKGTLPGLRTLITSYGIPDTVLRINEYGGKDKSNENDWDYWQDTFNYAYYNVENSITTDWTLNPLWNSANNRPSTLEFRFKVPDLSVVSGSAAVDLWTTNTTSKIRLRYTGSGYTLHPPSPNNPSGLPYSGSLIDPEYQFTHLDFFPDFSGNPSLSASVYLPFANEGWWSVMATREGNNFELYAGNNIYEGGDNGTQLGFYASSSVTVSNNAWTGGLTSQFMPQGNEMYLQEVRYYNTVLSESVFKDYIMNPCSSEGNFINSSPDQLAFRLTLGGELYTSSISIHPKITGSWVATSSFLTNSSASFASTPIFVPNTEYFFYDQPVVGIKNAISDKIRIENSIIPTGSVLSPFRSLAQNLAISQSYTANTNLLEVAFSPQNEIDQDIMDQIGYFDIGEFIGDPRLRSSSATSYPALDNLRNAYFEKYTKNYDLNDFMRLIKFFDNSLFKMIKDFVPARTSLASGVVIKQHLLERNKYPQPQTNINSTIAYYSSGSQNNLPFVFQNIEVSGTVAPQWNDYNPGTIENFSGGTGGTMDMFNGVNTSPYGPNGTGPENIFDITQSWNEGIVTSLGIANTIHDSQDEFYDGEFSGSYIEVTDGELNEDNPYKYTPTQPIFFNTIASTNSTPPTGQINWVSNISSNNLIIARLHINELSANGINIGTALNNLVAGNQITFTINGEILPAGSPFTQTIFTGIITSITSTSATTYTLNFNTTPGNQLIYYTPFNPGDSLDAFLVSNSNIILNPYLNSAPNYYNSDFNPLINNVFIDRLSSIYQDVDYSTGIATPTNFGLLISGSAIKAAVQDSNYTSKRVTLPRYEGSKSTSQHLNYWTPGDEGTYGKLPTIESLKTMVAYCDDIGGWPPERENASAAFIKYLIKSDGTVIIPNTSPNSLTENKGTFESGENVLIQYSGTGNQITPLRKVIRGGTRIEPILTNQSGSMPGGIFLNSITLTDNNVIGNVVSDFQAKLRPTSYTLNPISQSNFGEICFNQILSTGSAASLSTTPLLATSFRYQVNSGVLSEGIDLTFVIDAEATYTGAIPTPNGNNNAYYQVQIIRRRSGNKTTLLTGGSIKITSPYTPTTLSITIPLPDLQLNDEFAIEALATDPNVFLESTSRFTIYQTPIPNSSIPITSNFWISSSGLATTLIQNQTSGAFGNNLLITSASSELINYYGSPTVYQANIIGSGFNPIITPWSIKYGDEFRFEGREDRVYQIKQAAVVNLNILSSQIPFLIVELNQPVPISGSVNFDQFLIRRYVDEASQVLIEGFKPVGSSGPYIIRPEYVVPELDRDIDDFILILKEKGLI